MLNEDRKSQRYILHSMIPFPLFLVETHTSNILPFKNKYACNRQFKKGIREMMNIVFRMMVILNQGRQGDGMREHELHESSQISS